MNDLINISVGDAAMTALLGYAVVFIGIIMLMILVMFVGDLMFKSAKRKAAKAPCRTGIRSRHCRRAEAL